MIIKYKNKTLTYFGHCSVREVTSCQTSQQASNLQGAHIGATYEEEMVIDCSSFPPHPGGVCVFTLSLFSTHQCGLALVLDEEQLAPVGAGRLHPEHHQVRHRQQPQVRRQ